MTLLLILNFALIGLVAAVALTIMIYWHFATRGAWRAYSSGRSLMGLLVIIFFITGNAAVQWAVPLPVEVKAPFYFALYLIFAYALAMIGFNIRKEVRRGKALEKALLSHPSNTTTEKEQSHG